VLTVALKVGVKVTVEVATQVTYLFPLFTLVLGLYIETLVLGIRIDQGRNVKTKQNAVSVIRPFVRSFAHTFLRRSIHPLMQRFLHSFEQSSAVQRLHRRQLVPDHVLLRGPALLDPAPLAVGVL
jgi:hypothetical protein